MENKGQASAEYLLLIVVILIIIAGVTIPLVGSSVNATMDVSKASDTKNALQSISNAVNLVYANGPGARRTIDVYMPMTGNISVNNTSKIIYQTLPLSSGGKTVTAPIDYTTSIANPSPALSSGWHKTQIEWPLNATDTITVVFLS